MYIYINICYFCKYIMHTTFNLDDTYKVLLTLSPDVCFLQKNWYPYSPYTGFISCESLRFNCVDFPICLILRFPQHDGYVYCLVWGWWLVVWIPIRSSYESGILMKGGPPKRAPNPPSYHKLISEKPQNISLILEQSRHATWKPGFCGATTVTNNLLQSDFGKYCTSKIF